MWAGARKFEGIIPNLQRRYDESTSDYVRDKIEEVMSETPCSACDGHAPQRDCAGGHGGREAYPRADALAGAEVAGVG